MNRGIWILALLISAAPAFAQENAVPQSGAFNVADVDSGKIQPLALRVGCWQVRTQTNTIAKPPKNLPAPAAPAPAKLPTVDEAMKQWLAGLTPEQRAHLTQAQIDQVRTIFTANLTHPPLPVPSAADIQKQQMDWMTKLLAKGANLTSVGCTATPFLAQGKELYGTSSNSTECTRSVRTSGKELLGHIACSGRVTDYKRADAEHFIGTVVTTGVWHGDGGIDVPYTTTAVTTGKWIGEGTPHLPYAVPITDLDGRRPMGPYGVATFDATRLVAIIDGKQFSAKQAYFLINNSSNAEAENYGPNLANMMREIYLHIEIYFEARRIQERLDHPGKYPPGAKVPLPDGVVDPYELPGCCVSGAGAITPEQPGGSSSAFMEHQDALFRVSSLTWGWEFYFGQAKTPEEKKILLQQAEEKYKITVLDPDFFTGNSRE